MFSNVSILNKEFDEKQPNQIAISYSDIKKLLSPPTGKFNSDILVERNKAKSHTHGLIESKGFEYKEIQNLLDEAENINIHTIIDHKKYSLLHLATYNNNFESVKLLINHVKKQHKHKSGAILTEWVDQQTEDGFVAFHFAAYRGNLEMIQEFEKWMKGLHLVAQRVQPKSVVYFKKIGFDFDQKGSKGGTALHLASYYGYELAANYLLSFTDLLLDIQDIEGLTALHLATMSGNSRIVKKLLFQGADRNLKNNEGQTNLINIDKSIKCLQNHNTFQLHTLVSAKDSKKQIEVKIKWLNLLLFNILSRDYNLLLLLCRSITLQSVILWYTSIINLVFIYYCLAQ